MWRLSTGWRMSVSSLSLRSRSRNPRKFSFSNIFSLVLHYVVLHALPALDALVLDVEEIEHAPHRVVHQVVDGLGAAVERRHRREDDPAHLGDGLHVADVREVERRLARDEHQPPPLLQDDVGGAADQIVGEPVGHRGERLHRARRDYHAGGDERAARDRCADVAHVVHHVGELGDVLARELVLLPGVEHARVGDDEERLPAAHRAQPFQDAQAVDRPGGPGHRHDETPRGLAGRLLHACSASFFQRNRWFSSGRRMPISIAAIMTTSVMVYANTWSVWTRSAACRSRYPTPLEEPSVSATSETRQPKPKASRAPEKK